MNESNPTQCVVRIDWFALLAEQETLKSLLQHHSLKASILRRSALSMGHLSHAYLTTRKAIALTIQAFVGGLGEHFRQRGRLETGSWWVVAEECGKRARP